MTKRVMKSFVAAVTMAMTGSAAMAGGHGEITVGYFLEWPMPFLAAKASGAYDEALGKKVNWVSFETGTAMSAAMASGDVQLSVSQGVPPFVVATSGGQDIQIVDVAVSYSENDNCVVAEALEIDKDSAGELAGKKVAVPLGTATADGIASNGVYAMARLAWAGSERCRTNVVSGRKPCARHCSIADAANGPCSCPTASM